MATILHYEADGQICEILTTFLRMEGFAVTASDNLNFKFVQQVERAKPDVVILDFTYEGLAAIEMRAKIKLLNPALPVLAMSCNCSIDSVYNAYGFNDYIKKPFDIRVLLKVINKHLPQPTER